MASPTIPPLRYQKGNHGASPNKVVASGRPLSELSPMALRRNSPSFPQAKGGLIKHESSPAGSSPFSNSLSSPRYFWQGRDPASPSRENKDPNESAPSSSPTKRSSIENLKKASRVKNSTMFAKEQQSHYDPARPTILDGRPLTAYQGNAFGSRGSDGLRRSDSFTPAPAIADPMSIHSSISSTTTLAQLSPSKLSTSPTKSSLSKRTGVNMRYGGFDPESGIWEDEDDEERKLPEGRTLHRHAKSVTFDQAPPQVNEYEMTTPVPSSVASGSREGSYESLGDDGDEEYSFEREASIDIDDSFDASLEDTDKTPVVLPEDWRFMSPDAANTNLVHDDEDVFDDNVGSPEPDAHPDRNNYRPHQTSVNSVDSNGQPRPLPPLPASMSNTTITPGPKDSLFGAIERMSSGQRALPSPPPAATLSKTDLRRISGGSLSIEDRLRLMLINDENKQKQNVKEHPLNALRRMKSRDLAAVRIESAPSEHHTEDQLSVQTLSAAHLDPAPRISRDSILQQLRSANSQDEICSSQDRLPRSPSVVYDPDVPIPSLEDPTQQLANDIEVKEEDSDAFSLSSIPSYYGQEHDGDYDSGEDGVSDYSQASAIPDQDHQALDQGHETPRAQSPAHKSESKPLFSERISLPDFEHFGGQSSFDLGLKEYMTPPIVSDIEKPLPPAPSELFDLPDLAALRETIQRPYTPDEPLEPPKLSFSGDDSSADPGTPNSVIRHPISISPEPEVAETDSIGDDSKFTTRNPPAGSRNVSAESTESTQSTHKGQAQEPTLLEPIDMEPSSGTRVSSLIRLELTTEDNGDEFGLGFGLEQEFDRVVEAQKRGYLMRQNTKIVVASERSVQEEQQILPPAATHEEQSTPGLPVHPNEVHTSIRKASQPTWVAEPWNGKSRRKSIKLGGEKAIAKRKPVEGPVPPLPGLSSNVNEGLAPMAEDELGEEEAEEFEDGVERGRLFVKVVGAKDLQLPFPQHERTHFALTLDNGLHCVTTAWLDLAKDAPIGQEFELVVLNELEFQLTLQMKLEEPKIERPVSPTKPPPSPKKQGTFSKLFGSPKKKKDSDVRNSDFQMKRPTTPPSAYELVQGLVAKDGSFARAYVALNEHEKYSYGRPYSVDIKCFNEWAMEQVSVGSSRSKKSVVELQRRPPYEIGKLELQLLYVPKPKGAKDEDMPKSMNSAIRAMRDAEEKSKQQASIKSFEGYLSQQGGDCPYWRRRFFKLIGTKLTAYHETTLQPRATINLIKAIKLIDDKSTLTQRETSARGGGRRKSGFAEEQEGYMFVDEGFRIRFANGEMIDFYADSTASKDEWTVALSQVVGKGMPNSSAVASKGWTEMVLKRERCLDKKAKADAHAKKAKVDEQARPASVSGISSIPVPISKMMPPLPRPSGHARSESYQSADTSSRSTANSPVKAKMTSEERRQKARSMAF